ncbi:MAG: hypothetical protein EXR72_07205 [Myxococcales bacterium]|nr:hypothetical protein [Myxococcales bacterium]
MRSALAAIAVLLATAMPVAAATPEDLARAREIYGAGTVAFEAQMYGDAEQAFRDVLRILQNPAAWYDIALTLEKQRKWGPAADGYATYLRDVQRPKSRARLEKRIGELRGRATRQAELDAALNAARPEGSGAPLLSAPGNEVMKLGEADDSLLGFGEAGAELAPAVDNGPEQVPIWKKWWLWAAVGGAVLAAAIITIAVVATRGPAPLEKTTFGEFGPGASGALLTF